MAKVKLSPPWHIYYQELNAMFHNDAYTKVVFDEDENTIKLYVDNDEKAEALDHILIKEKNFGSVTLKIEVVPCNNRNILFRRNTCASDMDRLPIDEIFNRALSGTYAFSFSNVFYGLYDNPIIYIVFRNEVVQYFNDDLGDYYGQCSTLYQNIANDIFEHFEGVHYCTDRPYENKYDCCVNDNI